MTPSIARVAHRHLLQAKGPTPKQKGDTKKWDKEWQRKWKEKHEQAARGKADKNKKEHPDTDKTWMDYLREMMKDVFPRTAAKGVADRYLSSQAADTSA